MGYIENGLGFLIAPRPAAHIVHLAVYLDHGVKDEMPEENGISHLIEHVLFNVNRLPRHLAGLWQKLAQRGTQIQAWTGKEHTRLTLSFEADQLKHALDFVRQLLTRPLVQQGVFDHERRIVIDEIAHKRSRPEYLWNLVEEALYAPPYGMPVLGKPETVAALKLADLRRRLRRMLAPANVRLVLAGRCNASLPALVHETFQTWQAEETTHCQPPLELAPRLVAIPGAGARVDLYLAFHAPALTDKDRYAVETLAYILGQGVNSVALRNLRERAGLAYAVAGGSVHWRKSGYLFLAAGLSRENLVEGYRNLLTTISSLHSQALLEDEVRRAREALALNTLQEAEGPGLVHQLGVHWLAGEIYYPTRAAAAYRRVSVDEVRLATRYLDPKRMALIGLGIDQDELARLLEVEK